MTAAGEIVGTPTYLAPEQIEGRPTTPATDVYAVGVVLFEMLAGVAPFNGDSPVATALAHTTAPVPDVRSLRPDVPDWLAVAIGKAMAKDPADRFADAAAMQAALTDTSADSTAVLRASAVASEPTQVLPSDGYGRRRRRPWWLVGVAALAVAGLVGVDHGIGPVLVHHQRRPARATIGTGIADDLVGDGDDGCADDDRRGDRRPPSEP